MPAAEMMIGVTMGESSRPMTKGRPGMAGLASPRAASVPRTVATVMALKPTIRLLSSALRQPASLATVSYQRRE